MSPSSLITSRRVRGVTIALVAAAAIAIGIPQASSAARGHGGAAAATQEKRSRLPDSPPSCTFRPTRPLIRVPQLTKWTWMAIQLSNGESINLWDMFTKQGEQQWATVLHRDGSESVVSVSPLAQDARDFVTSPVSGQRYAGTWTVEIPGLDTRLTVADSPLLQELNPYTPHNEAAATVGGIYQGRPMTGKAYVEQSGNWK